MDNVMREKLINNIGINRYLHSLRVLETASLLGDIHNINMRKIEQAAILHDCGKLRDRTNLLKIAAKFGIMLDNTMKQNLELIHGPLGSKIAEVEYGIKNIEVLNAIKYHTTGRENMTTLDKIIYISDYIEPARNFKGVEEIRKMAFKNLDRSILYAMENTIRFLIDRGLLIHTDTTKARNKLRMLVVNSVS